MLVTNGCSFVWGDELEGYETEQHWHHTFTHKLSEKLEVPYVNLATCGACNQKIFRDTTDYLRNCKEKPTHLVILWSAWQREEVAENHPEKFDIERNIKRYQCMTQISPARVINLKPELREVIDNYYDCYDVERTGIIRTLNYMTTMEMICESMGIKLIQGVFHRRMYENMIECLHPKHRNSDNPWTKWMDYIIHSLGSLKDTSRIGLGRYVDIYTLAIDNYTVKPYSHPDEDAHTEYARLLKHIFDTQFGDEE